jgi:hypothetical protein
MKRAFLLTALLLFSQCSLLNKPEDNDDQTALALLLGLSAGCVIGGQTFIPSAGVTCSGGTASGTGTLEAARGKDEIFMQITPSFQSGGYLRIFAYAPAGNITHSSSVGVNISAPGQMSNHQNFSGVPFSTTGTTFCIEFHGAPHNHILYKNAACSAVQGQEAAFIVANTSQEAWGFELNNASLGNVTFFAEGILTEP